MKKKIKSKEISEIKREKEIEKERCRMCGKDAVETGLCRKCKCCPDCCECEMKGV
jgi:hypothetical protein